MYELYLATTTFHSDGLSSVSIDLIGTKGESDTKWMHDDGFEAHFMSDRMAIGSFYINSGIHIT
jgi:hypothetical protein